MSDEIETLEERRRSFLRMAADAEATAAKIPDPAMKNAWMELAQSWAAMAKEFPKPTSA